MGASKFTELLIWQRSREWSKQIFRQTRNASFGRDQRLVAQINDSSSSVMANIAEGFGRGTQAEFVQFIGYSIGSLNETQSHLCAAYDREYVSKADFGKLFQEGTEIRRMIVAFVKSMTKQGSGVKHIRKYRNWQDEAWERYEQITGQQRPELFRKKETEEEEPEYIS